MLKAAQRALRAPLMLPTTMDARRERIDKHARLLWAVISARAEEVLAILNSGANINHTEGDIHGSALHQAIVSNRPGMVRLLLGRRADPDIQDWFGTAPLHVACSRGFLAIASQLIDSRADLEIRTNKQSTPLDICAQGGSAEVARLLLERGARVNARIHSNTALHTACEYGYEDVAHVLIEYGADIEVRGGHSKTPLMVAMTWNQRECIPLLIEHGASKADAHTYLRPNSLSHGSVKEIARYALQCEFAWAPRLHRHVRRTRGAFHQVIHTMLLLRSADDAAFPWLPNELMFELFRALFDLCEPRFAVV